jgi:hypothetical protein
MRRNATLLWLHLRRSGTLAERPRNQRGRVEVAKNKQIRVAKGGTVHRIADAPLVPGKRFGDVMLSPGADKLWENGYYCPDTVRWLRRDGTPLEPELWSPHPGKTIKLKPG